MFEIIDRSKRKFSCFVCGIEFNNIETMNEHILKTHEIGREYIQCPLCGYCIRDLNLHAKAKHPNRKLPTYNGPARVLVWKDQKGVKRGKKGKNKFREGHFVSMKNGSKEFYYQSSYECEVFECLEQIPEIIAYDAQPFKSGIPYLYKGDQHHYFPDISIQFVDGHIEIWEIKPANQTLLPLNEAKWDAAKRFCQTRNWDFIVITEVGIGRLKSLIKKLKSR